MDFNLQGKRAIVTGGGVGIGKEIVAELSRAGARVATTYLTHRPDAEFLDGCAAASGTVVICKSLDATVEQSVIATIQGFCEAMGGVDILVNNAGGLIQRVDTADMTLDHWRKVQAVNMESAFLVTREVLKYMADGGRIINVASLAGRNGGSNGSTAYATSKSAMFGFTRGLAKEVASRAITVNAVAPGLILETPFHETFTPPEAQLSAIQNIALKRAGVPSDVAGPVLWLASKHAGFVTGAIIDINGGQYFA